MPLFIFHLSQVIDPFCAQGDITLVGATDDAVPTYGRMADAVTRCSPIFAQISGSRMRSTPAIDAFRQPQIAVGNTFEDPSVLPDESFLKSACSNTQNHEEEGMELFRLSQAIPIPIPIPVIYNRAPLLPRQSYFEQEKERRIYIYMYYKGLIP